MASGDVSDISARLVRYLPGWFPTVSAGTVWSALATGCAAALSQVYTLLAYVRLQTRVATATDGWLDLISLDFFGTTLPRKPNEQDAVFRTRILANLFPERGTRPGMIKALTVLTGTAPVIFEPWRPADAACFGYAYLGISPIGSASMPAQAFITTKLPVGTGGGNIAGLGSNYAGLGSGYMASADASQLTGALSTQDIYDTVNAFKAEGTTMWVNVQN